MTIRQRLIASFVAISLLTAVVGLFGLVASRMLARSVEGGDRHFRGITNAATAVASYARRGEGHLVLYLTLGRQVDRDKVEQRYRSLREQLALLDQALVDRRGRELLARIMAREGRILTYSQRLLEARDRAAAAGGPFPGTAAQADLAGLAAVVDEVAETALQLAHRETGFLNKQELITGGTELGNLAKGAENELMQLLLQERPGKRPFEERLNALGRAIEQFRVPLAESSLAPLQQDIDTAQAALKTAAETLLEARSRVTGSFPFGVYQAQILGLHDGAADLRSLGVRIAKHGVAEEARRKQQVLRQASLTSHGILAGMAIAVLLALAVGYLMAGSILRPLTRLSAEVDRLGSGDLAARVEVPRHDELGRLAEAFNRMAQDLDRLLVSRNSVENIFASLMDALLVLSPDQRVVKTNPSAERLLGRSEQDLVGRRMTELVDPDSYRRVFPHLLSEGGLHNAELNYLHRDGHPVPVLFSGALMRDTGGKITGLVCAGRDITQRKRTEEENLVLQAQLEQARKLETIGTLAGGIAHDFNNLLTPILGFTEFALANLEAEHPMRSSLDHVLGAAGRARELVRQILTFSQPGGQVLQVIDPLPVVAEAARLLQVALPEDIELILDLPASCPGIRADAVQLHQVIMNLGTNACQAMAASGGRLRIQLSCEPDTASGAGGSEVPAKLRLEVADSGPGMDSAVQDRIFEPFFTTKGVGGGTGLGLSVVHGIVKGFGGTIAVESWPGAGTCFRVLLPVQAGPVAVSVSPAVAGGDGERVLFVDDEEGVFLLGREVLESLGYRVHCCRDGRQALETLNRDPAGFDLVITDLAMPGMSGIDLAREVRRLRPGLPVVLLTGFIGAVSAAEAEEVGIRQFVMKPVTAGELGAAIRRALAEAIEGEGSPLAAEDVGLQA